MTANFSPIDIGFLISAIVSSVVYIYTLLILVRKRSEPPFNSHFFRLFISLGVSDLCSAVMEYTILGIECHWIDWAPLVYLHPISGTLPSRFPTSGKFFFDLSQYIGVLMLAANRFYNVEAPLWTAKNQTMALIAQWFIPTAVVLIYIVISSLPADEFAIKYVMLMQLSQLIIVGVVGVLYCRIYTHIRQIKKDFGISQNNKSELKLALVGLILLLFMLAQRVLMISMLSSLLIGKSAHLVVKRALVVPFHYLGIVFCLINPFLLLGCSAATRQAVFGSLCPSNGSTRDEQKPDKHSRPRPFKPRPAVLNNNYQVPHV